MPFLVNYSVTCRNPGRLLAMCGMRPPACGREEAGFLRALASVPPSELKALFLVMGGFMDGLKGYARKIAESLPEDMAARCDVFYREHDEGRRALLNEYAPRGLRMIEVYKHQFHALSSVLEQVQDRNYRFIIYMDDLSFEESELEYKYLKAIIEGGLGRKPKNVLIYATSNRRHLLRETFRDRDGDEVHAADTVQEAVSLSDRFGISLTFLMPDKRRFLDIVAQIAADRHLEVERETLLAAAEQWALERGARSPRYARQFVADAEARLARGESLL